MPVIGHGQLINFKDSLNFRWDIARKGSHSNSAASTNAILFTPNLCEQLAATVYDLWMVEEILARNQVDLGVLQHLGGTAIFEPLQHIHVTEEIAGLAQLDDELLAIAVRAEHFDHAAVESLIGSTFTC